MSSRRKTKRKKHQETQAVYGVWKPHQDSRLHTDSDARQWAESGDNLIANGSKSVRKPKKGGFHVRADNFHGGTKKGKLKGGSRERSKYHGRQAWVQPGKLCARGEALRKVVGDYALILQEGIPPNLRHQNTPNVTGQEARITTKGRPSNGTK